MTRPPRLVVLAIEGLDPVSLERYASAGWLPSTAAALRRSREVRLQTEGELFLASVWPCVASGVSVGNHGIHAFAALRSGTLDTVEGRDFPLPAPFWEAAVRAGARALVVDAPFYGPPPADAALDRLRFLEWGSHPPLRDAGSYPPAFARTLVDRYGRHPCRSDDAYLSSAAEMLAFQDRLCAGARLRGRMLADLLDEDPPDLLFAVFSEIHSAGHQLLARVDPQHPAYNASIAAELGGSPLGRVCAAVDAEVGRLLQRTPPDTTVVMSCLLGSRVTYGGIQMLGDLLGRMGLAVPARTVRAGAMRVPARLPAWLRAAIVRRLPGHVVNRQVRGRFRASLDWTATRAFALPWEYEGYLRVNQRGREPYGTVDPGAEREAILAGVEDAVRALRIAGSGEPAAVRIVRAQDAFPGRANAELPDLMVLWRNDLPFDAVDSPVYGRIANRDRGGRSEHTADAVLFAFGPAIAPGPRLHARDIDVAPTLLALLGVAPPDGLDGRPIAALLDPVDVTPA